MVELQAGGGEWFCALAWARLPGEQGRQADALEVLVPYRATGWWTAFEAAAEMLEGWGRIDEAIEITRVRMEAGHPLALESYTRLLARHGRAEEAFTLLRTGSTTLLNNRGQLAALLARHGRGNEAIDLMSVQANARNGDDWILHTLSDLCSDQGRPEDGLAHLDALAAARAGEEERDLHSIRLPLTAARDGIDEAIAQARSHPEGTTWYTAPHIAELLASRESSP
ncbi:hypothetical protein [Streptomyces sp. NPDC095613]|uniref:hypothetical protein n=1 Tax=Streptomyces sp. NPDC095613 TaxID=3155540 RepID=UPI00331A6962